MMLRMAAGMLLSLGIALAAGPSLIRRLNKLHFGTVIYELGPAHQQKQGTPVMGGLMIVLGVLISMLVLHPLPWMGPRPPGSCAARRPPPAGRTPRRSPRAGCPAARL